MKTEVLDRIELGSEEETRAATHVAIRPRAEVEATEYTGVSFLRKSWLDFKRTIREASQWKVLRATPYGLGPALVFSFLFIVKGFDGTIFRAILPEIVQDLDLNVTGLLTLLNLFGFVSIFAILVVSFYMDRVRRRVPFVALGTIFNGIMSVVTPHMRRVPTLSVSRLGDSVADTVASAPDASLILDYYPPDSRGKAFAMTVSIRRIGTLFAPWIIGLAAIKYGWRTPFYVTGPLLVVAGLLVFFLLKEPVRGYMERRAVGLSEDDSRKAEPFVSYGHAWRTIWGIRTLRRLFVSDIFGNTAGILYGFVYSFFLFEEYGLDALERGKLTVLTTGFAALVGGFLGGGIVDTLMRRRPQRVLIFAGGLSAVDAIVIGVISTGPPFWLLVVTNILFGFTFALTGPARFVFYGQIVPAHIRTLGLNVFVLAAIPATIFAGPVLSRIPQWGFDGVLLVSVPFFLISALIDISAAGLFERDVRSAMSSQAASSEYKRAHEAGEIKMLICRDVEVDYDGVQVLFGVDFDVDEGEIVALLGTNGAGKSTLLKAISGIQEASGGAVVYDGREITHVPGYEIAGRGIAHAPGGRGIFPSLTVRENLKLGTWLHDHGSSDGKVETDPRPTADIDLDEVLEIFPALKGRMDATGGSLSGGEQQMVSLAQAFLERPRLLLIDELSLGLSPAVVAELIGCVRRIHEKGVTIVVVEQSVNVALTIADRAVFMEKGEVKFSGPTRDLLRRPDILRAVYVRGTGALTQGSADARRDAQRRRQGLEEAAPVLEVQNLTRSFGGVTAVDDVSFTLRDGEVLGLIGPNGAGKTTIFDLISGFLAPDEGKVIFDGVDITGLGPDERARRHLIRRFQDARLFPSLTIYEALLVALDRRHEMRNMVLTALQLPQARASERRLRRRADQLIELLELGAFRDKFVKELSTGLRRITDIACMLATEPRVLLLDEPSSGIAQAEAESLGPLLQRVRVETGCSILIIEHDMPLISRVSDEMLALDQGKVVLRGTPDAVLNDKRVVESYLGTSEAAIRRSGALT